MPLPMDMWLGILLIVLILEAVRRTGGWVMVYVTSAFLIYALFGEYFPQPWTHKGYDLGRLVGHMFMTLEGIFGVAVDVSATLIVLFSIFGAFLQFSGAGKFFIDFSFSAMGGRPTGVGRTVVLSSFLLGGPSGSGVATTVTIGTVAYPMLAKAGYEKNAAGGLLAAGGLGAIISPPVLGAAAFLIAEFLKISYLDVLLMACIPTILFYASLFIMVEIDARKYGMREASFEAVEGVWVLAARYWFHFFSLISIIAFMLLGFSPTMSVLYATMVSLITSCFRSDTSLIPYDLLKADHRSWSQRFLDIGLIKALQGGAVGTLGVAVTCACAGLIVGTVTLTGLGLKFSGIVIEYAAGSLLLTAIYTALIVWVVGLAVPVTASYIICAVVAAPALIKLGVPDFAAHMFIFITLYFLKFRHQLRCHLCRGCNYRWGSLQDNATELEIYLASVLSTICVCFRSSRCWSVVDGLIKSAGRCKFYRYRMDNAHNSFWYRSDVGSISRLAFGRCELA